MKRLLIPLFVAVASFGFVHTSNAQAAFSCPTVGTGQPNPFANGGDAVEFAWSVKCVGNDYHIKLGIQFEQSGSWVNANCMNSSPCTDWRPGLILFWPDGSSHGSTTAFDVNQIAPCTMRWRGRISVYNPNGVLKVGPISGPVVPISC